MADSNLDPITGIFIFVKRDAIGTSSTTRVN